MTETDFEGHNADNGTCNCAGCQYIYRFSVPRGNPAPSPVVKPAPKGKVCQCGTPLETKTAIKTGLCRACRDKGESYGLSESETA